MSGTTTNKGTGSTTTVDKGAGLDTGLAEQLANATSTTDVAVVDPPRFKSPREIAREEINAKRDAQRAREISYGQEIADASRGIDTGERGNEVNNENQNPAQTERPGYNDQQQARVQTDPTLLNRSNQSQPGQQQPSQTPAQTKRQYNINGRIVELTQAEADSLATLGAEEALRRQQAAAQQTQSVTQQRPPQQQQQWVPPTVNKASADAIVKKLCYGNDDDSAFAIQNIIATAVMIALKEVEKHAPTSGFADQIVARALNAANEQAELQRDLDTIGREFPEAFTSPVRGNMTGNIVNAIQQANAAAGLNIPRLEVYREGCRRMYGELGIQLPTAQSQQQITQNAQQALTQPTRQAPAQTQPAAPAVRTTQSMADRLNRKRAASTIPSSVGRGATNISEQTVRPQTPSEIVAQFRRNRNQPAMS